MRGSDGKWIYNERSRLVTSIVLRGTSKPSTPFQGDQDSGYMVKNASIFIKSVSYITIQEKGKWYIQRTVKKKRLAKHKPKKMIERKKNNVFKQRQSRHKKIRPSNHSIHYRSRPSFGIIVTIINIIDIRVRVVRFVSSYVGKSFMIRQNHCLSSDAASINSAQSSQ